MKYFKDYLEERDKSLIPFKKCCESCGKTVKRYQNNYDRPYKFVFINIAQDPAKHYFCSKKCKNEWIFTPSKQQSVSLSTPNL
ncbi:MAG: hypothetical protein ACFE8N_08225 [Promethearchaeota archaeon]